MRQLLSAVEAVCALSTDHTGIAPADMRITLGPQRLQQTASAPPHFRPRLPPIMHHTQDQEPRPWPMEPLSGGSQGTIGVSCPVTPHVLPARTSLSHTSTTVIHPRPNFLMQAKAMVWSCTGEYHMQLQEVGRNLVMGILHIPWKPPLPPVSLGNCVTALMMVQRQAYLLLPIGSRILTQAPGQGKPRKQYGQPAQQKSRGSPRQTADENLSLMRGQTEGKPLIQGGAAAAAQIPIRLLAKGTSMAICSMAVDAWMQPAGWTPICKRDQPNQAALALLLTTSGAPPHPSRLMTSSS